MAPRVSPHPGTRPTERIPTVDTTSIIRTTPPMVTSEKRFKELEERLAHELLDDEERQELRDEIIRPRGER